MQIILLSGGAGKRLWPISNNTRSKQFIQLFNNPSGEKESMVQRVVRQLSESALRAQITIATSLSQVDTIVKQLGNSIDVIAEPERRDTFPAIALAAAYLKYEKLCDDNEIVVVMPCDPYTEPGYFNVIENMVRVIHNNVYNLVLMGITPTSASSKYGYIVPEKSNFDEGFFSVKRFTEKPDAITAEKLIRENAFWNGGVFAFKLGYLMKIVKQYMQESTFEEIRRRYRELPKISFDYEVVEKEQSVAVVPFSGEWKDLGSWVTLTDELKNETLGNVITDRNLENTHIINELDMPIICLGLDGVVIAASNDGILVAKKECTDKIKDYVDKLEIVRNTPDAGGQNIQK